MSNNTTTKIHFKKCPEALEFIRYDYINLSDIAPESEDAHNSARDGGVDQAAVNEWIRKIKNNEYTPAAGGVITPPTVKELPANLDGYKYRQLDGHHRAQAFIQLGKREPFYVAVVKFHDYGGISASDWEQVFMLECNDPAASEYYSTPCDDSDKLKTMQNLAQGMAKQIDATLTDEEKLDAIDKCTDRLMVLVNSKKKIHRTAARDFLLNAIGNTVDLKQLMVHHHLKPTVNRMITEFCDTTDLNSANVITREFTAGKDTVSRFDYDQFDKLVMMGMDNPNKLKKAFIVGQVTKQDSTRTPMNPVEVREYRIRKSRYLRDFAEHVARMYNWLKVKDNRKILYNVPVYWVPQTHGDPNTLFTVSHQTKRYAKSSSSKVCSI
jgi:hypothetical protein